MYTYIFAKIIYVCNNNYIYAYIENGKNIETLATQGMIP